MPSKSPAQARLMAASAHTKGGYGGVPQSVGEEFNRADKGTGMIKPKRKAQRKAQAPTVPPSGEDDDYQARSDASTLMRAEEIRSDKPRHEAAQRHVKKQFHTAARAMTEGKKRSDGMRKLATDIGKRFR